MGRDDVDAAFSGFKMFPGTTPPVQHAERIHEPDEEESWREMGTTWNTNKGALRLYPIGALRAATGMGYSTLRRWENEGVLPQPMFHSPNPRAGKGKAESMHTAARRLYTEHQIELVLEGIEQYRITARRRADWKGFTRFLLLGWDG